MKQTKNHQVPSTKYQVLTILTILTIALLQTSAFAQEKCTIEHNDIGKSYNSLKSQFNAQDIIYDDNYFEAIIEKDICDRLENTRITYAFIQGNLAKITLSTNFTDNRIFQIAEENFGKSHHSPNIDNIKDKNFADYWSLEDNTLVIYLSTPKGNQSTETLTITTPEYDEGIKKLNLEMEQERSPDNRMIR